MLLRRVQACGSLGRTPQGLIIACLVGTRVQRGRQCPRRRPRQGQAGCCGGASMVPAHLQRVQRHTQAALAALQRADDKSLGSSSLQALALAGQNLVVRG